MTASRSFARAAASMGRSGLGRDLRRGERETGRVGGRARGDGRTAGVEEQAREERGKDEDVRFHG